MTTPELQLNTLFKLNSAGRIEGSREPGTARGPLFSLIRGIKSSAWAIRVDVPSSVASELERLARSEPPVTDLRARPTHVDQYFALVSGLVSPGTAVESFGPAFTFPDVLPTPLDAVLVENEAGLQHNFRGWRPGEITAGRGPVLAIVDNGTPVSICFCARLSDEAAEAGLETALPYRRQGFGARVAAAWALTVRAAGRTPLYSTSWSNRASLGVARKLGLNAYACDWSIAT